MHIYAHISTDNILMRSGSADHALFWDQIPASQSTSVSKVVFRKCKGSDLIPLEILSDLIFETFTGYSQHRIATPLVSVIFTDNSRVASRIRTLKHNSSFPEFSRFFQRFMVSILVSTVFLVHVFQGLQGWQGHDAMELTHSNPQLVPQERGLEQLTGTPFQRAGPGNEGTISWKCGAFTGEQNEKK